jgi:hypothetical protein
LDERLVVEVATLEPERPGGTELTTLELEPMTLGVKRTDGVLLVV